MATNRSKEFMRLRMLVLEVSSKRGPSKSKGPAPYVHFSASSMPHPPATRPTVSYRRKSVVTASLFVTYLGGIILKIKMYANTFAGNQRTRAASSRVTPAIPRLAGMAKVKPSPSATASIRCHQMGMSCTAQNGQLVYGGLLPKGMARRSLLQFGQADHPSRLLAVAVSVICLLHWRVAQADS
jgi:hypothetical protein